MSHIETINAIFEQFDSYKNNCLGCGVDCPDCRYPYRCEDNDLICRKKLIQAANEIDNNWNGI